MAAGPDEFAIVATRRDDRGTTVAVSGELDLARADEFGAALRDALAAGDVTIDLSGLAFMDSAGVRALNTGLREAAQARRRLRVRAEMRPNVAQILELTGMIGLLEVTDA